MNYAVIDYDSDKVVGTCLQGYIEASYERLHYLFGEPIGQPDPYKVSTEWIIQFDDGVVATIYDYKETNVYDPCGPTVDEFRARPSYDWHIGGKSKDIVDRVRDILTQEE